MFYNLILTIILSDGSWQTNLISNNLSESQCKQSASALVVIAQEELVKEASKRKHLKLEKVLVECTPMSKKSDFKI